MFENTFEELKRYTSFDVQDEYALRSVAAHVAPHVPGIIDAFYERVLQHEQARRVLNGPAQIERLKGTLRDWLAQLLLGPWDDAYYERRLRIGRVHVKVALPQRFMFGAMNVIRLDLINAVSEADLGELLQSRAIRALHKIIDIELAIMLETYNESLVDVRLRRTERLAALGTMASGLAHELRNPLNSAGLQLALARRKLARSDDSQLQEVWTAVDVAESEMTRLAALVDDFQQFAKPEPLNLGSCDLGSLVDTVIGKLATRAHDAGVAIVKVPRDAPVIAEVDWAKVETVILNLVRNAIDASPPSGTVEVRVSELAGSAYLSVQDSGPGIAKDAPIFEPFFTTKDKGTGLGLAIVHRIVLDHGGSVGVDTRPGRTLFSVLLPMTHA